MKNWKKILTVVLALALLVSMTSMLSSCKDKNPDTEVAVDPEDLEAAGNGTYVISVKTAGGMPLTGAPVHACDLRAGAAMVTAGLCANGTTVVEDIHFIERGYENFVGKLRALGADISIVDFPDEPDNADKVIAIG